MVRREPPNLDSACKLECCVQWDPGESDPESNIRHQEIRSVLAVCRTPLAPSDLMNLGQDHRHSDNALNRRVVVPRTLSAGDPLEDREVGWAHGVEWYQVNVNERIMFIS